MEVWLIGAFGVLFGFTGGVIVGLWLTSVVMVSRDALSPEERRLEELRERAS